MYPESGCILAHLKRRVGSLAPLGVQGQVGSLAGSAQCAIQSEFGGGKEERGKRRREEAEGVEKAL